VNIIRVILEYILEILIPDNGMETRPPKTALRRQLALSELINKRDEYGNSLLHLAAWNGKKDMYDWLIQQKADPGAINEVGLTPLTLTVRFGIWDMFAHIRAKSLKKVTWRFGNVVSELDDFSQLDWRSTGPFKSSPLPLLSCC
jgi:hypothetical protein